MTRRRALWLALVLVLALTLLAGAALTLLPRYARPLAVWQLQALTGRPVTLDAFDLSFATGEFSLRGLRILDHDGGLLAELERLEGRFHRRSLLRLHLWIERLTLSGGHVRIVRVGPDRFNVSDLLERPASGRPLLDVSVDRFTLDDGWVALEDRVLTPARTWRSENIRLDAHQVTTLAPRGTAFGSTTIAGALVTVRVEALQLAPVHMRASVNLRDLDLRLPALYLPGDAPLALASGTLDAGLSLTLDARDGLRLDADAVVERLALQRAGIDGPAVTAPALRVLVRELHQSADGLAVRYASLGGDLTVLDPTTTPPRPLTFADLTLTASGLERSMRGLTQLALHVRLPGGGEVDVGGTAGLTPRRADLRVRARDVELASLAPYLPLSGRVAGLGIADVRVVATQDTALAVTVSGDVRVDRPSLADGTRTVAGAARLAVTGFTYAWPTRLAIGQLTLTQPAVTLERDVDGAFGLAALLRVPDAAASGEAPAPESAAPPLAVRIARVQIDDGRATFADAATRGRVDVSRLALDARKVTWPGDGAATLELSASVAGGEVAVRGTVEVARRRAELTVGVRGADLATVQPWLPLAAGVRGALSQGDAKVRVSLEDDLVVTVAGDATVERLSLGERDRPALSVARLVARGLDYAWPATLRVTDLALTQPAVAVERDAAGIVNLTQLARSATAAAASPDRPPIALDVAVGRLHVDEGRASLTDAIGAAAHLTRIGFTGHDLTWPARGPSPVRLTAEVAGGQLTATGSVDGARQRGDLALSVRGADLTALQPWLPIVGRVSGTAEADLTTTFELQPFTLAARGTADLRNLAFLEGTRPLLTVGRVEAAGIDAHWPMQVAIDRLRVTAPWAQVDRNAEGQLSLRALFGRRPDRPAPVASEPVAAGLVPGLALSVREALFDNGGLNIVDDAVEPAARFELRGSRLELRNLTWPARGPAAVQLTTPMPGSGTLSARGTFSIEPTRLQVDAELDQVDLRPGRPYLPIDARLNGRLTGRLKVDGAFGDAIALVVDGDAAVDRLALGDADRRLATAQRLDLAGLRYEYPTSVRLREVVLRKPWALVERNADGSLDVLSMLTRRRRATGGAPSGDPAPAPAPVRIALGKLTLEDGFLRFVDRTTTPDFAEELAAVSLTAEGLGTDPRRHGSLDLRGRLASGQPLTVRGQLGALTGPRFFDFTVETQGYPVVRLNPYLDQLSTWIARQGALTASLRYRVDDDELDATNVVAIHGLELDAGGRGNEVQARVGLPLGLLVSLLKNQHGNIELTIPVHGRLSAPDFDYGDAMWAAVRNLAIKLVALPFSWVGQLLYTADARIDSIQVYPIPFQTAGATPTPTGDEMLQRLRTFLKDTPAIRLRVRPVTTVADVTALRRRALEARLAVAGADAAGRRQAALALYAELFPRRQPPPTDEALLDELTGETPPLPRALRTLATDRVTTVRETLTRAGIDADRLEPAEARAAVEREGEGRVEFEIVR